MKLYLLSQDINDGHDTYDSCVVCAKSKEDAVTILPCSKYKITEEWAELKDITCIEIGKANNREKRGVIIASFNAG